MMPDKVRQPRCIVCGQGGSAETDLAFGESHGFGFWLHGGGCSETLRRINDLVSTTLFASERQEEEAMGRVLPFSPSVQGGAVVLLGAGPCIPLGVPGFGALLEQISAQVGHTVTGKDLAASMQGDLGLFQAGSAIFSRYAKAALPGYVHYVLADAVLTGNLLGLITTNWDLLLEETIDRVVETVHARRQRLSGVEFGQRVRVVVDDHDLTDQGLADGPSPIRPTVIKPHGSPFAYYCRECAGSRRFHFLDVNARGPLTCMEHSECELKPYAVISESPIDSISPELTGALQDLCESARCIVVLGYSGRDPHLFTHLLQPNRERLWVVAPARVARNDLSWNLAPETQRLDCTASGFSRVWSLVRDQLYSLMTYSQPHLERVFPAMVDAGFLSIAEESEAMRFYFPSLAD